MVTASGRGATLQDALDAAVTKAAAKDADADAVNYTVTVIRGERTDDGGWVQVDIVATTI